MKEGVNSVTVAIECYRQKLCKRGIDGTCKELEPKKIPLSSDWSLDDWIGQLNYEEPLRNCELGFRRSRTDIIIEA